ncbi:30S ribosomal protein S8 [Candidatus Altiarchaeales archaeon WOR_SM1_SCG]|nr:30S ribosomal protein S8 [Candidatus Altiarchaeales archaeon WOR_SM1_SCG]
MMHDLINDAISNIKNHEREGKAVCTVKPTSKLLINILRVFQKEGYIGEFELEEDKKGGIIKIKLLKRINECGTIKPRFSVKHTDFVKWEKQFLPARDFGTLVVSTPGGVMTHREAKEKGIGGRLLAYVY